MQAELIPPETANYASAVFPAPRDFQAKAHDRLRQGVKDGHKCQAVMAPTGAGKTYLGMRIIHEALLRGNSAIFMCDRTTLIQQTSAVADHYDMSRSFVVPMACFVLIMLYGYGWPLLSKADSLHGVKAGVGH